MRASAGTAAPVAERLAPADCPLWIHPDWQERFPWLVQGTTGRGAGDDAFDLGLFGAQPVGDALGRWRRLIRQVELPAALHARQVHGAAVRLHAAPATDGLRLIEGVDGHLTDTPGLLLTVSVADCVPIFLVDPDRRAIGLLHAGWRGVAAGILEAGVAALQQQFGSAPDALWMHCGPAICGACYEVGAEVHAALRPDAEDAPRAGPLDLRRILLRRAERLGLDAGRCSRSAHCTRCTRAAASGAPAPFFSHRGGDAGRQMAVLGLRPPRHASAPAV